MTRLLVLVAALAIAPLPAPLASQSSAAPALRTSGAFFALIVSDVDATRSWYREKLGLSEIMDASGEGGARAVVLSGGGLTVELVRQPGAVPLRTAAPTVTGPLGIHGIFKVGMIVEDYDTAIATLPSRGITFAMGPFPAREGFPANAILRDNEGNYLQIISR